MKRSLKNKPLTIQIETTDHCNHKCIMCARTENPPRPSSKLSLKDFQKIISQVKKLPTKIFVGHNLGEPLMTPNYIEMLEYFDKNIKNKYFIFNTNASRLSLSFTKRFLKLKNNKYQINFSLDAATAGSYKKLHNSSYALAKKNILAFLEEFLKNKNKHIEVILNFIVTPVNYAEQKKFITQWKPFLKENERIKLKFNPLAWNNLMLEKYNHDVWTRAHPDAAIFKFDKARKKKCLKPWQILSLRANGDVSVCCYDVNSFLKIGNFRKNSLSRILKGRKFSQLKKDFNRKNFKEYPLCYFCHA